ncbi:ADP-ribosylation factor [Biomphalaria glabrata]|nr:ADP-ribosylation factor-like [Biomphalaria glabrata]
MGNVQYTLNKVVASNILRRGKKARILMLGIDGAGKTSLLFKMSVPDYVVGSAISTLGFNVEKVKVTRNVRFTLWDVGGQEKLRPFWKNYFENTDGILFVLDSTNEARLLEVKNTLESILRSPYLKDVPVVILANKQDFADALDISVLVDRLELASIKDRRWLIQGTSAFTGAGVWEALKQMKRLMKESSRPWRRG